MKKLVVLVLSLALVLSFTTSVYADANASWNAAKGTAVVDGVKDAAYKAAPEVKMAVESDLTAGKDPDDTTASFWALYDSEAIYFFVEVKDSSLDDANANVWEKDSIELRVDNKDRFVQAYAVSETVDDSKATTSEVKVLKTDVGYNVEFKVPYATEEGASIKFSMQVNCAKDGARNKTLHTNDDLKNAWQDNTVFENLVFASGSAPKTGVASYALVYGIGAALSAAGVVSLKGKRKDK